MSNLKKASREFCGRAVYHVLLGWLRWWRPPAPGGERRALIVTPGAGGSLGDEAMVQALKGLLVEKGFLEITIVSLHGEVPASYLNHIPAHISTRSLTLAGTVRRLWKFVGLARMHSHCFVIGADVMDCFYSERVTRERFQLASLAARLRLSTTVTGFSLRSDMPPACARMIRQTDSSVRLCLRDAVSLERLNATARRTGELVADLAFLLEPEESTPAVRLAEDWCEAERAAGHTIVGVNANFLTLELIAADTASCVQLYAELLKTLAARMPQLSFLLIPHDTRKSKHQISDLGLCVGIAEALPLGLRERCHVVRAELAAEIKGLVKQTELVFTGRMHVAIAALGQGVPAAGLAYQGKFEGLYRHFGLADMQISPSALSHTTDVANWLLRLIETRESLRAQVAARLPEVLALARRNVPEASLS